MCVRVPDCGEVLAIHTALIDQLAHHGRGSRRRKFPIRFEAVLEFRADGLVVGMAFDPNLFVRDGFQNVTDLFQNFYAGRFHLCLAGIEQDAVHHIDGEAVAHLLNGDIAFGNFVLQRFGEFFLCPRQPFDLFFFGGSFLIERCSQSRLFLA